MFKRIRRLFERRSGVRTPADWLYSVFTGGGPTLSGVTVSPDTALTLSSYFAAIRAISEDVAKLPLIVYRREERGKSRMSGTPLYRLLHDEPNPEMSAMTFRETLMLHAISYGNGYAEITRDKSGKPTALWPMDPRRVRIERDPQRRIIYRILPTDGGPEVVFTPRDVFHLHGLGFDGLTGYSVATLARESIGAALAAEKSGAALFGNGSRPDAILTHPGEIGDKARSNLTRSIEERHGGPERTGRLMVLEEGMGYMPIAVPNRDAQWIEARGFNVGEMCRWLRIAPHKVQLLIDATYSNIESQSREYVCDTLTPWLVRWEQEIARKLIPARSQLFAEHLVDGLLRGDTTVRFNAYQTAIQSGWMSRNEARALENLNPEPGLDEFLVPLNSGEVGRDDTKTL